MKGKDGRIIMGRRRMKKIIKVEAIKEKIKTTQRQKRGHRQTLRGRGKGKIIKGRKIKERKEME